MPIFEYQCRKCGKTTERIEGSHDAPMKKCPECGGKAEKVQMSVSSFQLKGAGWYKTDYAGKGACAAKESGDVSACHSCPAAAAAKSGG